MMGNNICFYGEIWQLLLFAMDIPHNFGSEFLSEKPVRVLHEIKISRFFSPPPSQRFDGQFRR